MQVRTLVCALGLVAPAYGQGASATSISATQQATTLRRSHSPGGVQAPGFGGVVSTGAGTLTGSGSASAYPLFLDRSERLPAQYITLGGADVTAGDIDGDGLDDLALVTSTGLQIWRQTVDGTFVDETATRLRSVGQATHLARFIFVDGDDRPELFLAATDFQGGDQDQIWWNDGRGFFSSQTSLPLGAQLTSGIVSANVDGLPGRELILAKGAAGHTTEGGADLLLFNDGNGAFVEGVAFTNAAWNEFITATTEVVVGDFDGNGTRDLFFAKADPGQNSGSPGATNVLLFGDGNGNFTDVSATNLLPSPAKDQSYGVQSVDVDGDGDLDFVLANTLTSVPGPQSADVLLNQGGLQGGRQGVFVDAAGSLPEAPPIVEAIRLSLVAADFNLDGLYDVGFGVHDLPPGNGSQPFFLGRPGTPITFQRLSSFDTGTFIAGGMAVLDVGGDGDLDLFMTASGSAGGGTDAQRARLYINTTL